MMKSILKRLKGKNYSLSITRDYVHNWELRDAVRELIQNALDNNSEFEFEFKESAFRIFSPGATLKKSSLLLGNTSKRDAKDKIGQFGEGYKLALLVLTRMNKEVRIINGTELWTPSFKFDKRFEEEVLTISVDPTCLHVGGLEIQIHDLTDLEIEAIKDSCLRFIPSEDLIATKYGAILLDKPGKLYVGTLFICSTELDYGYNILPEYIKLERDRQTVNGWDLKILTSKMWIESAQHAKVAELLEKDCPDVEYIEYAYADNKNQTDDAAFNRFKLKYAGKIPVSSQDEEDKLRKNGITNTVVLPRSWYSSVVRSSFFPSYMAKYETPQLTPHTILERWYEKHKSDLTLTAKDEFLSILNDAEEWSN